MLTPVVSRLPLLLLLMFATVGASGCQAIEGIFKTGMWVGIIVAVLVMGGAVALIARLR